ncbi:MAG: hypothetical protein EPO63_07440 [Candidatus Nitrosotenuis sp.]|nr:MAG: hypothetical protein EPO63_07440 [Candidatus Nitrosotenuis sp.]
MIRSYKIAIIACVIAAISISALALIVHSRLSQTESSEITSGQEAKEKETPSQIANEIANSLQNKPNSEQNENNEQSETTEQNENTKQPVNTTASTIVDQTEISIKEIDGTYRWSSPNEINPTITLTENTDNVIQFTNPTDTKHAFIIGLDGKIILESKDIRPSLSGKLKIKPTESGVFEYHCKYHPDTMKGIVNVIKP